MQPGGKLMPGESAVDALRREIAEELGVEVEASSMRPLGRHVAEAAHEPGHTVEADSFLVSLFAEPRAAAEIDEIAWVDPANPGDIDLAPLTRLLIAETVVGGRDWVTRSALVKRATHCGSRTPPSNSGLWPTSSPRGSFARSSTASRWRPESATARR
jgi:8-oxo-dGTP diphosphatase